MRGTNYTDDVRLRARSLVLSGKTYSEIRDLLRVPKSTLSTWFAKKIKKPFTRTEMRKHLASIRGKAMLAIKEKYRLWNEQENVEAQKEVDIALKKFPKEDNHFLYKYLLAMLYWAEGSKSGFKFTNTDPALSLLYITLLRKVYRLDESKFSIGLHIHYYHSIKRVRKFWSHLLRVPENQFNKVRIKKRSVTKRFRKNFAGICFIYYGNSRIKREILLLAYSLQKFIINPVHSSSSFNG